MCVAICYIIVPLRFTTLQERHESRASSYAIRAPGLQTLVPTMTTVGRPSILSKRGQVDLTIAGSRVISGGTSAYSIASLDKLTLVS